MVGDTSGHRMRRRLKRFKRSHSKALSITDRDLCVGGRLVLQWTTRFCRRAFT